MSKSYKIALIIATVLSSVCVIGFFILPFILPQAGQLFFVSILLGVACWLFLKDYWEEYKNETKK